MDEYSSKIDILKDRWFTLQEASNVTGKSINALTLLIARGKIDRVRKIKGRGKGKWLIHKDSVVSLSQEKSYDNLSDRMKDCDRLDNLSEQTDCERLKTMIPLDYYELKRTEWVKERDDLLSGLMMYRYKFEDLDRKMRLLPAPPEYIEQEIRQRNEITDRTRKELTQAQKECQEKEEIIKAELIYRDKLILTLQEKEQAIAEAQNTLRDTQEKNNQQQEDLLKKIQVKLQEEQWEKEALNIELERVMAEADRPWWKKLFGLK